LVDIVNVLLNLNEVCVDFVNGFIYEIGVVVMLKAECEYEIGITHVNTERTYVFEYCGSDV
jgi:hypothetical protein